MSHKKVADFDRFGAFEIQDEELLDNVVGGGVNVLETENSAANSSCLNGVCFDEGNGACATLNPACSPTGIPGRRLNPVCGAVPMPDPTPGNAPCPSNRTCYIP